MSHGGIDKDRPDPRETLEQLRELQRELKTSVEPATVAFFDLVGSTKYRRDHGASKGLNKAEQHNSIVSESVLNHGGEIVKLLGDGVMAMFRDDASSVPHPIRALQAGLDAVKKFREHNEEISDWVDKIQTKVGLSTGDVHLLPESSEEGKELSSRLDPMGSTVDLAARLESLAMPDTILIDRYTFWGESFEDLKGETHPVCRTPEVDLNRNKKRAERLGGSVTDLARAHGWRRLLLDKERETTYLPQAAPFQLLDEGLEVVELSGVREPTAPAELQEQADQFVEPKGETDQGPVVFACEPVDCNIAGFKARVEAIAVSLEPQQKPVKQSVYDSPSSDAVSDMLNEADAKYQQGEEEEARVEYERVVAADPRDFRANVRLAQYWRRRNDRKLAGDHWNEAKKSNPNHGMIWALASTTHMETYVINTVFPDEESPIDQSEIDKHRDRSITGFTRARHLAAEAFDSSLEQHCTYSLVICHSIRKRPEDVQVANELVERFPRWPPQTLQLDLLKALAEAFYFTVTEGRDYKAADEALQRAEDLLKRIAKASPKSRSTSLRQEAIMQSDDQSGDFELLMDFARSRLRIAKRRAKQATAKSDNSH